EDLTREAGVRGPNRTLRRWRKRFALADDFHGLVRGVQSRYERAVGTGRVGGRHGDLLYHLSRRTRGMERRNRFTERPLDVRSALGLAIKPGVVHGERGIGREAVGHCEVALIVVAVGYDHGDRTQDTPPGLKRRDDYRSRPE